MKQTTYPPNQKADTAQGGDNVKREKRPKTLAERLTWPLFFALVDIYNIDPRAFVSG